MSEAKPWLEPLHEAKIVALSVARWIPPTTPSMADDEDLALASSVFQAEFRAFLPVKLPAAAVSAPAPQRNAPSRAIPRSRGRVGSYPLLAFERRSGAVWPWACLRPCPAPKPRDRRAARARGTRGSLRRTLVARPALAVAISAPSLLARSWTKPARTGNRAEKQGRSAGQTIPTRAFSFKGIAPFPRYRGRSGSDWNQPLAPGVSWKEGPAPRRKVSQPCPQADRLSRFLALIWAMRTGPSENSPSPAFRVNSRK